MPIPAREANSDVRLLVENQRNFANTWVFASVNSLQAYINRLMQLVAEIQQFPPIQPQDLPDIELKAIEPPEAELPDLVASTAPERPFISSPSFSVPPLSAEPPEAPEVLFPSAPALGAAPTLPTAPTITDVELPDAPEYELPPVPTLAELDIPDAPDIDLSQFTIEVPEFHREIVEDTMDFNYISTVQQVRAMLGSAPEVAGLLAKVEEMLIGGTGLDPNAELAMYERSLARDDLASRQAEDEALQQWSSRGFSMPGAQVLAALARTRMENRQARQNHNRDVYIRAHEVAVENLRFAIQQGVAYQGMLFDNYLRFYDAARQIADSALSAVQLLVNARLEIYKTELLIFQARIEQFKAQLQGELAKLEVFRGRLEGERLKAEISRLEVDAYQAQLQGVLAVVQIFKTQVDAVNSQIAANASRVELYKSMLEGNRLQLDMDKLRYDIYGTSVQAEATKVSVFDAQVRAFASTVQAYSARVQAESARVGAINDTNRTRADVYGQEVRAWASELNADVERFNAAINAFRGKVELYNAQVQQNATLTSLQLKKIDQVIEKLQVDNASVLKQADQQIAQLQHASQIGAQGLLGAANAYAQLAASAMSAINVGASMQDQTGYSIQHSASYEGGPA